MIFNMTGGGAALNFNVVPNPQPDTAKENTIWVDTDRINNCYFSATQPEGMVDYDVWFYIGTSSPVEFNALKKGGIQVYPVSAKQYVNGALVDKSAKSYQGGNWIEWWVWNGELFDNGNQYEPITGGWEIAKLTNSDSISIGETIVYSGLSDYGQAFAKPKKLIPLKDYAVLNFTISKITRQGFNVQIYDKNGTQVANYQTSNVGAGTYHQDISAMNDDYEIWVGGFNGRAGEFSKVWLE